MIAGGGQGQGEGGLSCGRIFGDNDLQANSVKPRLMQAWQNSFRGLIVEEAREEKVHVRLCMLSESNY